MAKFSMTHLGITAALAWIPASQSFAFVAPAKSVTSHSVAKMLNKGEKVIRPSTDALSIKSTTSRFANRFHSKTQIEVDTRSGAVRLITGSLSPAPRSLDSLSASDLIDVATNWIASHEDILQVQLEDTSIHDDATLMTKDVQFIRFNVTRNGTPVADASINFRFKHGQLVQVQSRTFGEALDDMRSGFINATEAIEKISTAASIQEQGQVLRVQETASGYRLVRVNKAAVTLDGETFNIQTDAATGEVYESRDTKHYVSGNAHGNVFPRTYYQSQAIDVPMIEMDTLVDTATVRTGLDGKFTSTGNQAPKVNGVKGFRVSTRPSTGTAVSRTATDVSGVWDLHLNVTAEKDQAQVHTFHHLNLIVHKAKKYISSPWMERPLTANVNLGQTCNAYWNGTTVNFYSAGGGCGNTGLISDVMYHEWGHGLDHNTGGIDDGAYSEGFGDILSMIMTNDSKLGPGFRSNGGIVRDMEPDKIYPQDQGEVHAEGLIIGGTFWDLFKALSAKYDAVRANEIVSDIAFKTIFTATAYTDVYAAALVVNDNDSDTSTRSPDMCEINAAFTAHGLAAKDTNCP